MAAPGSTRVRVDLSFGFVFLETISDQRTARTIELYAHIRGQSVHTLVIHLIVVRPQNPQTKHAASVIKPGCY